MPYTTASRYCQEVGYDEASVHLVEEDALLTSQLLREVVNVVSTGAAWSGTTTAEQRAVALAAHDRLVRKIGTVGAFMDGYLRVATTLPIAADDPNVGTLEECCQALVRDELASSPDVSNDLIVKVAERWRKWLVNVSNKVVSLAPAPGTDGMASSGFGKIVHGQAKSGFDWSKFGGGGR